MFTRTMLHRTALPPSVVAEFKNLAHGFEDASRMGHPSTITTDENVEAVERIGTRDRQIPVRRVTYELGIPKNHHP